MGRGDGELVPPHRGKVLGSRPPIVVTVGTVPRCGPAVDCVGRETPTGATFGVEGGEAGLDIPYAFTLRQKDGRRASNPGSGSPDNTSTMIPADG